MLVDPQMYNKFQAFIAMEEKEQEKAKRKRQESGSKKQKPKKQRPMLSDELDIKNRKPRNTPARKPRANADPQPGPSGWSPSNNNNGRQFLRAKRQLPNNANNARGRQQPTSRNNNGNQDPNQLATAIHIALAAIRNN